MKALCSIESYLLCNPNKVRLINRYFESCIGGREFIGFKTYEGFTPAREIFKTNIRMFRKYFSSFSITRVNPTCITLSSVDLEINSLPGQVILLSTIVFLHHMRIPPCYPFLLLKVLLYAPDNNWVAAIKCGLGINKNSLLDCTKYTLSIIDEEDIVYS